MVSAAAAYIDQQKPSARAHLCINLCVLAHQRLPSTETHSQPCNMPDGNGAADEKKLQVFLLRDPHA